MWAVWWVWVAAGFVLATLEVVLPGYVFVGFAIGAILTGLLLGLGILGGSVATLFLVFALASLVAWLGLRAAFGRPGTRPKIWDRDINDN